MWHNTRERLGLNRTLATIWHSTAMHCHYNIAYGILILPFTFCNSVMCTVSDLLEGPEINYKIT